MNTNTNEKIVKLMARYKDKTLSRSERQEAMEELNLADTFIFAYMGLADKKQATGFSAGDAAMAIITALLIAAVIGYLFLHSKYKIEPADELANRYLAKVSKIAFSLIAIALFAVGLIISWKDPTGVLSIENRKIFSILCSIIFLHGGITNFAFVMLEGKEEAEEE